MTKQQLQSSGWFTIITLLVLALSIFTSNKVTQADLSTVSKALEEASELLHQTEVATNSNSNLIAQPQTTATSSGKITPPTASQSALVTRIIDGDTFELESGETVRYIGIDTPETKHPQKGVECFGKEAAEKNTALLLGKVVNLEKDVNETDRYGRLLRYVWIGDTLLNESLVLDGYAVASAYPPDVKYQKFLDEAETVARESNQGLWRGCDQVQP